MSYQAEKIAIETRFNTSWNGLTPVHWENDRFKPDANTAFVELDIVGGSATRSLGGDVGSRLFRNYSNIVIKVYVPKGEGAGRAVGLIDSAIAIFRDAIFSGIVCYAPEPPDTLGEISEWYVVATRIPFHRDEIS